MVRAWIADVSPLYETERYQAYYRELPDFRRKKADALRAVEMKAQSVGVWTLWEKIRREMRLPGDTPVNFSHSGQYVMCAAVIGNADTAGEGIRVGCDIEKIGPLRENVAGRFFCPEEYNTILSGETEGEKTELFYRYWVLKESFMKATGKGMALPVDAFCIRLGRPPELIRQPGEFPEKYHYMEYKMDGIPYKMAVCSTDREIDDRLHTELRL